MWGHPPHCRCGVCSTLRRVCHHISDFSPKPGYIPFAADRLRVLAGELCDWGDSYYASGAAQPGAVAPPQAGPEGGREEQKDQADPTTEKREQASGGIARGKGVETKENKGTRRERDSGAHREKAVKETVDVKEEPSEDSAFNSEEKNLRTTASKSFARPAPLGKRVEKVGGASAQEISEEEVATEPETEEVVGSERERKRPISPRSPSVRDKKRSRRTRSRSRRRRRKEDSDRGRVERSPDPYQEEVDRAREGHSSSAHPEAHPRPTRRPSTSLPRRPRSPNYPPPAKGKGRGRGWHGYPPRQEWTNKGVKKVGRQLEFKEYLAYKKYR